MKFSNSFYVVVLSAITLSASICVLLAEPAHSSDSAQAAAQAASTGLARITDESPFTSG
jgi:hypothetical protein